MCGQVKEMGFLSMDHFLDLYVAGGYLNSNDLGFFHKSTNYQCFEALVIKLWLKICASIPMVSTPMDFQMSHG